VRGAGAAQRPGAAARWRTPAQRRAYAAAPGRRFRLEYLPRHGSWLNQIELFFSALARRFLRRGDFASADQFAERLGRFLEAYNAAEAHPYRWSFAGTPRVRGLAVRRNVPALLVDRRMAQKYLAEAGQGGRSPQG
jgi:hypothetical protein